MAKRRIRVAYQGVRGAFSEAACHAMFEEAIVLRPCRSFEDVFRVVEDGRVEHGVVPIENSLGGSIDQTYDLLLGSDLVIAAEHGQPIDHCLLALPGTPLEQLDRVYSHPQALAQCQRFLKRHARWEVHAVYDTAGAARIVREQELATTAAIASERAGEIYRLEVLARGIQDAAHNVTRFVKVGRTLAPATGQDRTSLVFSTRDTPGALHKSLSIFAIRDINLKKLESRPSKEKPWDYIFYADLEGHVEEERIARSLDHLREISRYVKVLGSYPVRCHSSP